MYRAQMEKQEDFAKVVDRKSGRLRSSKVFLATDMQQLGSLMPHCCSSALGLYGNCVTQPQACCLRTAVDLPCVAVIPFLAVNGTTFLPGDRGRLHSPYFDQNTDSDVRVADANGILSPS